MKPENFLKKTNYLPMWQKKKEGRTLKSFWFHVMYKCLPQGPSEIRKSMPFATDAILLKLHCKDRCRIMFTPTFCWKKEFQITFLAVVLTSYVCPFKKREIKDINLSLQNEVLDIYAFIAKITCVFVRFDSEG